MIAPLTPEDLIPSASFPLLAKISEYIQKINTNLACGISNFEEPNSCYLGENRSKEQMALNIALTKFREVGWNITETKSTAKQDEGRITYHFIGK